MAPMPLTGLNGLIASDAELRRLGEGFMFTEGPVWIAAQRCLLFSDIPGDSRWRWTPEGGVECIARPTAKANGMCLDRDGHLLVCEHISSSLTRIRDGRREVVAWHYRGRYLNSPNDVAVRRADGSIYFTDPNIGRASDRFGVVRSSDLDFEGVFRVPADGGEVELVVDEQEFTRPNGLCFSPDQSVLYVNDSSAAAIKAFDVRPDGSLSAARLVCADVGTGVPGSGNCDGMECDEHGNIWVTGPGGVWVLTPQGDHIGTIGTAEVVGSLCWGADDLHTLFLMTSSTVHAIDTLVGPAPLPPI
jgi:gluconolactonase